MELPGEATPLELLTLDAPPKRVAGDPPREIDGHGGAVRELLRQSKIGAVEALVCSELVVRDEDPDRNVAEDEWNIEPGPGAEVPRGFVIDLVVLE